MRRLPAFVLLPLLAAAALLSVAVAMTVGTASVTVAQVWATLAGDADASAHNVVLDLRLPRALAAFATGGMLAVAGTFMQVLLRNPLADPYILGVSGGAAVAALAAITLGLGELWIQGGAFCGALGATLLVFSLAHSGGASTPTRLLLTGVVVAAGLSAVISLLLALGSDSSLRGMLFWLMGDLSFASMPLGGLAVLAVAVAIGLALARHLNVLSRGDLQAEALGVDVRPLRVAVYLLSALLTAVAVTSAGTIGFIGLVVPHLLRLISGPDHRIVLPGAALFGGALLVLADTVSRTALAPRQLPVGALTALIGVPLFLALLARQKHY